MKVLIVSTQPDDQNLVRKLILRMIALGRSWVAASIENLNRQDAKKATPGRANRIDRINSDEKANREGAKGARK